MTESEAVSFFPDSLYKTDLLAPEQAPPFIRTAGVPFYDANFFFAQMIKSLPLMSRYSDIKNSQSIDYVEKGRAGDVYKLNIGEANLALKFMFNSRLNVEHIEQFLRSVDLRDEDLERRVHRLSGHSLIDPQRNILANIAGALIGHQLFPDYIDKPNFIFSNQGKIIGFASPMITGQAFSLAHTEDKPDFHIDQIEKKLIEHGVKLDRMPATANGIEQADGKIKLIDIGLEDYRLLEKNWDEVLSSLQ